MNKKRTTKPKRRITQTEFLKYLNHWRKIVFPLTYKETYKRMFLPNPNLEDYFPFSLGLTADQLLRKGYVEKIQDKDGVTIKITDNGNKEILKYDLASLATVKSKWEGKWWLVFFDVAEVDRKSRDWLRDCLIRLGMEKFQESVFISPYDITKQVEYVREILNIPHAVKIARLDKVENEEELKEIFELK